MVKLLIEKGADINATKLTGVTPLGIAEQNGQREIVELLNTRDSDVLTLLFPAAAHK